MMLKFELPCGEEKHCLFNINNQLNQDSLLKLKKKKSTPSHFLLINKSAFSMKRAFWLVKWKPAGARDPSELEMEVKK